METIYKQAIDKWGEEAQIDMMQEECIELALAIRKLRRHGGDVKRFHNFCEELADVTILTEQMQAIPHINNLMLAYKNKKLNRLKKRINKN